MTAISPGVALAMDTLSKRDDEEIWYHSPFAAKLCSCIIEITTACVLSSFITLRAMRVRRKGWQNLPWIIWLVFLIYGTSLAYSVSALIMQFVVGNGTSRATCRATALLCPIIYMGSKIFIFLFLVDRAHVIRSTKKARLRSKLYLWNIFLVIGIYGTISSYNIADTVWDLYGGGCRIYFRWQSMIPLIAIDPIATVYLTILFLQPLCRTYSLRWLPSTTGFRYFHPVAHSHNPPNRRLRQLAKRTIIGSIATMGSSLLNCITIVGLRGEVAWLCMMCCTSDILFSAIVIHWMMNSSSTGTREATEDSSTKTSTRALCQQRPSPPGVASPRPIHVLSSLRSHYSAGV
ncbi:hypothetical protein HER10_EVM0003889 [Colletotrichum scovillei]|nr:uncharacterized protein HER10_EVM0003889 [Colletotrichum scovillei]KAF4781833.1 hypothetical protein HER10_EVM0003889 [Colletotrichum scovillei]